MTIPYSFNELSTDELVAQFKATTLKGQPPQELLEKAYAAIRQIEQHRLN